MRPVQQSTQEHGSSWRYIVGRVAERSEDPIQRRRTMRIQYFNHQDELDPMHGIGIDATAQLAALLDDAKRKSPFIAKLKGGNGFEILTGIGAKFCCAQYSSSDGNPPYLM